VFGAAEPVATVVRHKIQAANIEAEAARLEAAIVQSRKQLLRLRGRLAILPEDAQAEIGPLIDAYGQMLAPSSRLVRQVRRRVTETLVSPETAVMEECAAIAAMIQASPIDETSEDDRASRDRRSEEVREIGRRLVRNLTRQPFRNFSSLPAGAILVSESLSPADAALLDPSRLAGVATDEGGAAGHTAIMLRALGVPAVLGVAGLSASVRAGDLAVIHGGAGTVVLNPDAATLAAARQAVSMFARQQQKLSRLRRLPARTEDGHDIELSANMEIPAELPLIAQAGAVGIGLLRSEFLFMNREGLPDERAQTATYRSVIEAMDGDPVTIRVLDWGGEKEIEALNGLGIVPENPAGNPALGLRGIRLLLRHPDLFEVQLAAILRAATAGPVRVLLPMVTNLAEVRDAREIYERVIRRLRRRGERLPEPLPPLGIMVETPGAALAADALALEADFFAIGTNDLTMYTLAVDRSETEVAPLYDPLHPAVLRLVQFTTEAALRMRKPVSVCGEMAGEPKLTPLLLGLGLRSFSMNAAAVPRVKQAVRNVAVDDCVRFARRVMEQSDPEKIRDLVMNFGAK
jgi:phosphotransferase system enzyme I (PtsI)